MWYGVIWSHVVFVCTCVQKQKYKTEKGGRGTENFESKAFARNSRFCLVVSRGKSFGKYQQSGGNSATSTVSVPYTSSSTIVSARAFVLGFSAVIIRPAGSPYDSRRIMESFGDGVIG